MDGLKDRLVARALDEGFVKVGVRRPDAVPEAAGRLRAFLAAGRHGQMGWMEGARGLARSSAAALRPGAVGGDAGRGLHAGRRSDGRASRRATGGWFRFTRRGRITTDIVKRRLKRLGRWLVDASGAEIKVFVDTAPVGGKAAWRRRRVWAGRASIPTFWAAIWETGCFWRDLHHVDLAPDAAGGQSLRQLHRLSGCLSDRGIPRALSVGCAALHFLSDD